MDPLITICIPTHKRLQYLKESVHSALSQTWSPLEILIGQDVDPNTGHLNEDIATWVCAMASRHPQIRYQHNQQNLGLARNWNALAAGAQGEFLVIIGDDDRLLPAFVETLAKAIAPGVHTVFSNHFLIDASGHRLTAESHEHTKTYKRDRIPAGEVACPEKWVWQNAIPISSSLISTRVVQQLKFKEDLNCPEIELFIRMAHSGGKFVFVPGYLAEYRYHPDQETAFGLRIDRLLLHLMSIPVSEEIEPYKREFITTSIVNATSWALREGLVEDARAFLSSRYYPGDGRFINYWIPWACCNFPRPVGVTAFRCLDDIKKTAGALLRRK